MLTVSAAYLAHCWHGCQTGEDCGPVYECGVQQMDVFYHLVLGFNHSGFQSYRSIQSFVIQNLTGIQLAVLYLLNNEISRLSCGPYGYTFTTSEPTHPMLHVHVLDGWNAFCPITAVVMVYCHAFRTHSLYCSLLNTHFPFRMAVVSSSQEFHTS